MVDPDLQMGGGGFGSHSDHEMGGAGPPGPSPGSATAFCVQAKALRNDFSTELT